jgi:hypothetical protein
VIQERTVRRFSSTDEVAARLAPTGFEREIHVETREGCFVVLALVIGAAASGERASNSEEAEHPCDVRR